VNPVIVRKLLLKDLRLGPRSPLVLWALVLPIFLTVMVRGVFGSLFDAEPRLGIADLGSSALTVQAQQRDGLDVSIYVDEVALRDAVADNAVDAGIVLPAGFDDAVRSGLRPTLELLVAGESLASNRILVTVATLDLVRGVADQEPPAEVELVTLGDAGLSLDARMVPLLVIMAVAIGGVMAAAAGLVQEKERGTITALLVTPVSALDVLVAKGLLGVILATLTGLVTLALNGGFGTSPAVLVIAVAVGAIMMAEVGLLLGSWAKNQNTLFTAWKGGGIFLLFPVFFYLWPGLPQWIPKLSPTYYFLQPIFELAVEGATAADVWIELVIAAVICGALVGPVLLAARYLEQQSFRAAAGTAVAEDAEDLEPVAG
jgi:ABC-2 type transport system permease protein